MTITTPPTLDHVLHLAIRLLPADKLRLIELMLSTHQIESRSVGASEVTAKDMLVELDALITEAAVLDPLAQDSADLIREMRR